MKTPRSGVWPNNAERVASDVPVIVRTAPYHQDQKIPDLRFP